MRNPSPDDRDEDRHARTSSPSASRRASPSASTRSAPSRAGDPSTGSGRGPPFPRSQRTRSAARGTLPQQSRWRRCMHWRSASTLPAARASGKQERILVDRLEAKVEPCCRSRGVVARSAVGIASATRSDAHVRDAHVREQRPVARPNERWTIDVEARRPRYSRTRRRTASAPRSARAPCRERGGLDADLPRSLDQVGWASASSTVTCASSSTDLPETGRPSREHQGIDRLRRSSPRATWKSAECPLSTGRSSPPTRRWAATASSSAATRLFLVGESKRDAVLERPDRCLDACEPDDGVEHDVRLTRFQERNGGSSDLRMRHRVRACEHVERL